MERTATTGSVRDEGRALDKQDDGTGRRERSWDRTEPTQAELDLMRRLRSEAHSLREVLAAVKDGEYGLEDQAKYLARTLADTDRLILELEAANHERALRSDSIASIVNHWEQAGPLLRTLIEEATAKAKDPEPKNHARQLLRRLTHIDACLAFIVEMSVERTAADRLARWLDRNEPGDVLSFHRLFEDELPSAESRRRILGLLASKPRTFRHGIIDPSKGLIFRCATGVADNAWRIAIVGLTIAACLLLLHSHPQLIPGVNHQLELSLAWLALLAGMAAQHIVARRKQKDPDVADYSLPLTRWPKYVAARAGSLMTILLASVMVLGIYAVLMDNTGLGVYDTFLLGYGFDSFIDLVSAEADRRTAGRLESARRS